MTEFQEPHGGTDCVNIFRLTIALMLITGAMSAGSLTSNRDPIVLIDQREFPEYRAIWSSKLLITPFDCGRVTVLPFGDPEYSISIYSRKRPSGQGMQCSISYISASENLWERTDGGHYPEKARVVKTRRIDADVPEKTAELLRQVWSQMLRRARKKRSASIKNWEVIPKDSTNMEWSLEQSHAPPLSGQLNNYVAKIENKTEAFIFLSNVILVDYCKAKLTDRPGIARRIDQKANELLKRFNNEGNQ